MNQKIQNLKLLLKNDRRAWLLLGAGSLFFIMAVFIVMGDSGKSPRSRDLAQQRAQNTRTIMQANQTTDIGAGSDKAYKDLTRAFGNDITAIRRQSEETNVLIDRLQKDLEEHKTRSTGIFDTIVDRVEVISGELDVLQQKNAAAAMGGYQGAVQTDGSDNYLAGEVDSLESFGLNEATVPPPPPPEKPEKLTIISSADAVPLRLLTGVNAPVDGTPYPVIFEFLGPVTGPDGSSLDLGEARLLAAAQGSEADGRVLFRLTKLAIRHKDGRRSEVDVDGWIVGEDGIRGMKGHLVDKLGRLIAATAGISFSAAMGDRLTEQASGLDVENSSDVTISGEDFQFSGVSSFTDSSNRLGEILLDRYEKLVPVVEVLSGREVIGVFSQATEVELYESELDSEGIYAASLD